MADCDHCDKRVDLPFNCKFCGGIYCDEHRLPENHECLGLEEYKEKINGQDGLIYEPFRRNNDGQDSSDRTFSFNFGIPTPTSRIYSKIIYFCVFIFFLQWIIPSFTEYFYFVPVLAEVITRPWTLITSIFMHGNSFHLFVNMLVLFFFGGELERRIGSKKFLELFMVSGILANFGYWSYAVVTGTTTGALGASGAIFGVFAALAIIAPEIKVLLWFFIPLKIRSALIIFALWDLFLLPYGGPIANSAHLAGLAVGVIYGYLINRKRSSARFNII